MNKENSSWKEGIQTFGRSLLLPIALLAPIGMVMGICSAMGQSYMIDKFPFLGNEIVRLIFSSLQSITSIIFNNIPLLFAMGVAQGMAKQEKGIAVFASTVGYLALNIVMNVYLKATGTLADPAVAAQVGQGTVLGIQTLKIEALGGLIAGLVEAKVADRFYRLELPPEEGFIPKAAAEDIGSVAFADLDMEEMSRIKEKVGHGFVPFVKVLVRACRGEGKKYVHYGVTTQNIQQTSQLYTAKEVTEIYKSFLADILEHLAALARENAHTVMAGRTHGKHAIPITYGYKVSVWISELLTHLERFEEAEKRIFTVMMGGAVGGFNATGLVGRRVQEQVAERLNMSSMEVPSRNMSQMKVEYLMNLCLLCNTFHKMAEEVYYTGIEEFSEVCEGFTPGTIGSSTMPQKINPKLAKGIIANSQKLYSLPATGLYSAVRMFEGDSSSYMLFDGLMEEAMELTAEVLIRAEELTRTLNVNKERMLENANINHGLDNSEYVMMKAAERLGKDKAHELLYDKAMKAELENKDYFTVLTEDETLSSMFTKEELKQLIDPASYTGLCSVLAVEMADKAEKAAAIIKEEHKNQDSWEKLK